jgi:hypothetical protein
MPTGGNGHHLFVICTAMCANNKFVLANITTWTGEHCDATVRFQNGDHPFIDQGRFVQRDNLPEPKLTEVETGLLESRFTPRKVKNYLAL